MNRREFIQRGAIFAAAFVVSGCGGSRVPGGYSGGGLFSSTSRPIYRPRPIPDLLRSEHLAAGITLYKKQSWCTESPQIHRLRKMDRITRITVHHEGNPTPFHKTDPMEIAEELRMIRRSHMRRMKAGDIGYHYIIDPAGKVWEGRSTEYQGAHVRSNNAENLGIMVLGNFEIQQPTPEQLETLNAFLKNQMELYAVPASRVFGHRELRPTECPGKNLFSRFKALPCLANASNAPRRISPEPASGIPSNDGGSPSSATSPGTLSPATESSPPPPANRAPENDRAEELPTRSLF